MLVICHGDVDIHMKNQLTVNPSAELGLEMKADVLSALLKEVRPEYPRHLTLTYPADDTFRTRVLAVDQIWQVGLMC